MWNKWTKGIAILAAIWFVVTKTEDATSTTIGIINGIKVGLTAFFEFISGVFSGVF